MDSKLREYIEWTNVWQEGGDKGDLPRVLLLGDSIVSAYRDAVQENVKGKFYVDKVATSRSFDQKFYWDQLELYISDPMLKYDMIFFNFGLHGFHIPTEEYGRLLEKLADRLIKTGAKLCYMLTTPMINPNSQDWAAKQMDLVVDRNSIATKIMNEKNINILDQYSPILGNMEIRAADEYHYNNKGIDIQAKIVADKICQVYSK